MNFIRRCFSRNKLRGVRMFSVACTAIYMFTVSVLCIADEPAPVPMPVFIIKSAQYDCVASGDTFQGKITVSVQSLQDDWTEIPLLSVSAVVSEFSVPPDSHFLRGKDNYNFLVAKKGLHQITVLFTLPVEKQDELRRIKLPVISAAMADMNIKVDGRDMEFQTMPSEDIGITDNNGTYSLHIRPGTEQALVLSWYPAALKDKFRPAFSVKAVSDVLVENRIVSTVDALFMTFPAEGKKELVLDFKSKARITSLEGEDISGWFAKDNEYGGMSLNIRFQYAVNGTRKIIVRTETVFETDSFVINAAPAVALGAKSQQGTLRIYASKDINMLEQEKEFVERVEQPSGKAVQPLFSYNYSDARSFARFTAQPKHPVRHVKAEMLAGIEYDGFMEMACRLDFNVKEVEVGSLSMDIPLDCSVTSVKGADVLKWDLKNSTLNIALKNKKQGLIPVSVSMEKTFVPQSEWEFPVIKSQGVLVWEGTFAIKVNPEIFVSPVKTNNLVQINVQELPDWLRNSAPSQAYRFINPNYSLVSVISPVQPKISTAFIAYFNVYPDSVYGRIETEYTVEKRGVFYAEIKIPGGFFVTDVSGANIKDWGFRDDRHMVKINFEKAAVNANSFSIELERKLGAGENELRFEAPYAAQNNSRYEALMIFGSDEDIRITPASGNAAHELSIYKLPEKIRSRYKGINYAFRFNESGGQLAFSKEILVPQMEAQIYNSVSVRKGFYSVQSVIYYKITNARTNRLEIAIPDGAVNSELNGTFIKSKALAGNIWTVELAARMKGNYRLDIKYESNISDKDGKCTAEFPRPAGAGKIDGYVVAGKIRQGDELTEIRRDMMQAVEPSALVLPVEFTKLLPATPLYYYAYNEPSAAFSLQIKEHTRQDILEATMEYCELNTLLRNNGEIVTMLTAEVSNTSKQTIFVTLPDDGILWGAYINNKPVKPVSAKGGYKIPVFAEKKSGNGAVKFELAMLWGGVIKEGLNGKVTLVPPEFDVEIEDIKWGVYLPKGYNVVGNTDDMKIFYRDPAAAVPSLWTAVYASIKRYYSVLRDFTPAWLPSAVIYIVTGAVIVLILLIAVKILLIIWNFIMSIRLKPVRIGIGIGGLLIIIMMIGFFLIPFGLQLSRSPVKYQYALQKKNDADSPDERKSLGVWGFLKGGRGGVDDSEAEQLVGDESSLSYRENEDKGYELFHYRAEISESDREESDNDEEFKSEKALANSPLDGEYGYDSIGIGGGSDGKARRLDRLKNSQEDQKKSTGKKTETETAERVRQKEKDSDVTAVLESTKDQVAQQMPEKPAGQPALPVPSPAGTQASVPGADMASGAAEGYAISQLHASLPYSDMRTITVEELSKMNEIYSNTFNPTKMGRAKGVFPIAVSVPAADMHLFAFEMPYKGASVNKLGIYCFGAGLLLFLQIFACAAILAVSIAVARHSVMFAYIMNIFFAAVFFFMQSIVSPVYARIMETALFFAVFLCIVFVLTSIAGQLSKKLRLNN